MQHFSFLQLRLARQFMLLSLLLTLGGMLAVGILMAKNIEAGVMQHTAAVTSMYIESFVSLHLQEPGHGNHLDTEDIAGIHNILDTTPLGQEIVEFRVWSPDGVVLYSTDSDVSGERFAVSDRMARALAGEANAEFRRVIEPEHRGDRAVWRNLIEIYVPIRSVGEDRPAEVVAVAEFYQPAGGLITEIRNAQRNVWVSLGAVSLLSYVALVGLVNRASRRQLEKKAALDEQITRNQELHARIRRAAAGTTASNERALRRTSADLHDGPAQDLALALLQIESLADCCVGCTASFSDGRSTISVQEAIKKSLQSALDEIRAISAGLRLPEIDTLSVHDTAHRAVRDYERKSQRQVAFSTGDLPSNAPLSVKITLYRIIQEALANGFRHAGGEGQAVQVGIEEEALLIEVRDEGKGFDPESTLIKNQLGLRGMRERVEMLGGSFSVSSANGNGTRIAALLPYTDVA